MTAPYITDQIKTLVERVSNKLLTTLQEFDSNIKAISYHHGRKYDIVQLLKQKDETPDFEVKETTYPMVWLYEPIIEEESPVTGCWARVTLNLAVFNTTDKDYTPEERYDNNFKPILDPIANELIEQIDKSGWYHLYDASQLKHKMKRCMMWGTSDNKNELNYYVDAVEFNNLVLDVYFKDECES